jgi:hypothetical protein
VSPETLRPSARGYLTIVGRTGVRPDSLQASGGMLSLRLPTRFGVAHSRFAYPSGAVPERGSRGDCRALNCNGRPATTTDSGREGEAVMAKVQASTPRTWSRNLLANSWPTGAVGPSPTERPVAPGDLDRTAHRGWNDAGLPAESRRGPTFLSRPTAMVRRDLGTVPEPSLPNWLTLRPVRRVPEDPSDGVQLRMLSYVQTGGRPAGDVRSGAFLILGDLDTNPCSPSPSPRRAITPPSGTSRIRSGSVVAAPHRTRRSSSCHDD